MIILHFGAKNVVFNKINFISENYRSFTETTVIGTETNSLKNLSLIRSFFLDFTGIGSLKNKDIRVSGAKLFWWVYLWILTVRDCRHSKRGCADLVLTHEYRRMYRKFRSQTCFYGPINAAIACGSGWKFTRWNYDVFYNVPCCSIRSHTYMYFWYKNILKMQHITFYLLLV